MKTWKHQGFVEIQSYFLLIKSGTWVLPMALAEDPTYRSAKVIRIFHATVFSLMSQSSWAHQSPGQEITAQESWFTWGYTKEMVGIIAPLTICYTPQNPLFSGAVAYRVYGIKTLLNLPTFLSSNSRKVTSPFLYRFLSDTPDKHKCVFSDTLGFLTLSPKSFSWVWHAAVCQPPLMNMLASLDPNSKDLTVFLFSVFLLPLLALLFFFQTPINKMAFALPSPVLVQFSSSTGVVSPDAGTWGPQPGKQRGSKAGEGKNPLPHTSSKSAFLSCF